MYIKENRWKLLERNIPKKILNCHIFNLCNDDNDDLCNDDQGVDMEVKPSAWSQKLEALANTYSRKSVKQAA